MKTMQDFYTQMTTSSEEVPTVDCRLPSLNGFNKTQITAMADENPWFWWEALQPIVTE